jgi:hypothetical protein
MVQTNKLDPVAQPHEHEANVAMDNATRYASDDSKIGAVDVRKLATCVWMLADPDMEDHLARMTEKLCEHVYDLSELIKGIERSNAMQGLHLIAVTPGLFVTSLGGPDLFVKNQEGLLQMCPVRQMFASHHNSIQFKNRPKGQCTKHNDNRLQTNRTTKLGIGAATNPDPPKSLDTRSSQS